MLGQFICDNCGATDNGTSDHHCHPILATPKATYSSRYRIEIRVIELETITTPSPDGSGAGSITKEVGSHVALATHGFDTTRKAWDWVKKHLKENY